MISPLSQKSQTTQRIARLQAGLAQLAEACEYVKDRRCDPWEFAIDVETLVAFGLTTSDLRWLASKGHVEYAHEVTASRDRARKFRPSHHLAFDAKTCFVLTDAGALFAATVLGPPIALSSPRVVHPGAVPTKASLAPQWDNNFRVLRIGRWIVKKFKVPSPNQEAILAAFQEEGWPSRIDDPLHPQPEQDSKCRLHDTIKSLNRHHQYRFLQFRGDGTGEGVCWEYSDAAAAILPADNMRKKIRLAA